MNGSKLRLQPNGNLVYKGFLKLNENSINNQENDE